MNEAFLAYIWKFGLFDRAHLTTTSGEPLVIEHPGWENKTSGPDFFNARIKIGSTTWAGNIEIHVNTSDWFKHGHQNDAAYQNIILHLVFNADVPPVTNVQGQSIPTLALEGRINPKVYARFQQLHTAKTTLPCQNLFAEIPAIKRLQWTERLLIERLEQKMEPLQQSLHLNQNNWQITLFEAIARALGGNLNAQQMEMLVRSVPYQTLLRQQPTQAPQLEALLLGQAQLLPPTAATTRTDPYVALLLREYEALKNKYQLTPLMPKIWKTKGLRPLNSPTIRIAQLAALIQHEPQLFDKIIAAQTIQELFELLAIAPSEYWQTHYVLGKPSAAKLKTPGQATLEIVIINALVPLVFLYGRLRAMPHLEERALNWLHQLPPEQNHITQIWQNLGWKPTNATDSQAMIQLKKYYCDTKKCLHCAFGHQIINYNPALA